jgi:hypothetical protein
MNKLETLVVKYWDKTLKSKGVFNPLIFAKDLYYLIYLHYKKQEYILPPLIEKHTAFTLQPGTTLKHLHTTGKLVLAEDVHKIVQEYLTHKHGELTYEEKVDDN